MCSFCSDQRDAWWPKEFPLASTVSVALVFRPMTHSRIATVIGLCVGTALVPFYARVLSDVPLGAGHNGVVVVPRPYWVAVDNLLNTAEWQSQGRERWVACLSGADPDLSIGEHQEGTVGDNRHSLRRKKKGEGSWVLVHSDVVRMLRETNRGRFGYINARDVDETSSDFSDATLNPPLAYTSEVRSNDAGDDYAWGRLVHDRQLGSGWHKLRLGVLATELSLTFTPIECQQCSMNIQLERGDASQASSSSGDVAWFYIDQPATLRVEVLGASPHERAPPSDAVTIEGVTSRELISRLRNISFAGLIVSMYLLRFLVLSIIWVLSVGVLRRIAYEVLRSLPTRVRREAAAEMQPLLAIAKWGGVGSYAIWTVKDLVELAIGGP